MAKLCIYNVIETEEEKLLFRDWTGLDGVCYKDITEFLESIPADDSAIDIKIHCPGGDCVEGWAIYDALRNSGKTISATIEGECSSMATIILLAAPVERRFAYENARMCIHNPAVSWLDMWTNERLTADEIRALKAKMTVQEVALIEEQDKIIKLYVERTGTDRETLQALMNEDKYVDMERAKELGFISSTLAPNTDRRLTKNRKIAMAKEQVKIENRLLKKLLSLAGFSTVEDVKVLDQQITAADGTVFTVEREDGDPQVGDKAYPNGTYVLDDGTTVVVEDEIITSITPAEGEGEGEGEEEEPEANIEEKVSALEKQIEDLQTQVNALTEQNTALKEENDTLVDNAKTEEETAILDIVEKAGGKAWLESLKNMSSTFSINNRKFVEHGDKNNVSGETRAQKMLREQRERQEGRRSQKATM